VCCVLCAVCCVLCAVCCVLCAVCCVLCAVCCVSSEWDGIFQKFNVFIFTFSLLLGSLLMPFARLTIADIFINVGLLVVISHLFVEISRFGAVISCLRFYPFT